MAMSASAASHSLGWSARRDDRGDGTCPGGSQDTGADPAPAGGRDVTLATLPDVSRSGVISPAAVEAATLSMRDRPAIRMASPAVPVRFLSGGNQQKVSIAEWLLTDAAVYPCTIRRGVSMSARNRRSTS